MPPMKVKVTNDELNGLTAKEKQFICDQLGLKANEPPAIHHMIQLLGDDWWANLFYYSNHPVKQLKAVNKSFICKKLWEETKKKVKKMTK